MKGVAPNGSMLASSILLMMELPAMEAASPARSPAHKHKASVRKQHRAVASDGGGTFWCNRLKCVFTRADDACVEHGEVLLAGGERCDGEGAVRLGAAAHSALCRGTGTPSG